jgi:tetratricopeptide (TPR) repeat protein
MSELPQRHKGTTPANLFHKLMIAGDLVQRNELGNEDLYFQFVCGRQAYYDKRFDQSILAFTKVISYFHDRPDQRMSIKNGLLVPADELINSFLCRGISYFAINEYTKSESDFESCLQLDSDFLPALRNVSVSLLSQEKGEKAIGYLAKFLRMKEFCPEETRFMGHCYRQIGELNRAKIYYKMAADLGDRESTQILTEI